jgi:tetratricopeptide (TPR) repeat protein
MAWVFQLLAVQQIPFFLYAKITSFSVAQNFLLLGVKAMTIMKKALLLASAGILSAACLVKAAELPTDSFNAHGTLYRIFRIWEPQTTVAEATKTLQIELANREENSYNPTNLLSALGQLELSSMEPQKAVEHLTQSIALREKSHDTKSSAYIWDLIGLAEAQLSLSHDQIAEITFKHVIPLLSPKDPRMDICLLDLADVYACSKRQQQAEVLCDEFVSTHFSEKSNESNYPLLEEIIRIGEWYRKQHKFLKAEHYLQMVVKFCSVDDQADEMLLVAREDESIKESAERILLECFIEERKAKNSEILLRKYPPEIKIGRWGYQISLVNWSCACTVHYWSNPPGLKNYWLGLEALKMRRLQESERRFERAAKSSDTSLKHAAMLGLAKCYQIAGNNKQLANLLSDFAQTGFL